MLNIVDLLGMRRSYAFGDRVRVVSCNKLGTVRSRRTDGSYMVRLVGDEKSINVPGKDLRLV